MHVKGILELKPRTNKYNWRAIRSHDRNMFECLGHSWLTTLRQGELYAHAMNYVSASHAPEENMVIVLKVDAPPAGAMKMQVVSSAEMIKAELGWQMAAAGGEVGRAVGAHDLR